ncbi:MAG: T9SS type A sorting domain-containing protein [Calditrichaeota bacterium]|nr:T9SS type A sorting domain-containing protein [Calditrichota bacterium]
MSNKFKSILLTLGLLALIASTVGGQPMTRWAPADGYAIRQGHFVEWYRGGEMRETGQLTGEVCVTWSDTRNGDRGVYVQVVTTEAALRFKYPLGGLRISDTTNRQEDPGVWPTADGGWIIAWEDFDRDSLGDIYCTKIDAQGRRLWGGSERGLPVCMQGGIQEDVRIVEDGAGGAIIAWRDMRSGDVGDIYAQHILADGRIDPNWPANGLPVVAAVGAQTNHTTDEDGEGGMIIAWKDGRIVGNFDIWAQRISPNGHLRWGNERGVVVCGHEANQEAPKLCPDGAGGVFVCWIDDRNQEQTDKDIYAQHLDASGRLLWPAEGEAVCIEPREQSENRIVASESGNAIVLWEDKRGDGLTSDVYTMRISGAQRMRKEWNPTTGVPIIVAPRNQAQSRLFPDGQGGAYIVWEDERERPHPEVDIWSQHINRSGQLLWPAGGVPVCRASGWQHSPLARRTADGGCFFIWADLRTGSLELYGQKLTAGGELLAVENGVPIVQGLSGNAVEPAAIPRLDSSFTVYWLDGRFGGAGQVPFIQTVRDRGDHCEITMPVNGRPVLTGTVGGGLHPSACADGAGGTIMAWEDRRGGEVFSIYIQRLNANGDMLWGESGRKVADFEWEQAWPFVCSDGAGGAYVAWRAPTDNDYYDVYMQRISPNGERMWGDDGRQITSHLMDEEVENIIPDGSGGVVLVWKAFHDDTDEDLWMARLNSAGEMLWDDGDGGIVLCNAPYKQKDSRIVRHQTGYAIVWVDGRDDQNGESQNDIYGQFINLDGTRRWADTGAIICGDENHQEKPALAIDNGSYIWVAWEDHRRAGVERKRDIFIQKIHHTLRPGGRLWTFFEMDGREVCPADKDQLLPNICHDGQNGMWLAWEDYRSGVWTDLYAIHLRSDGTPYPGWNVGGNLVCGAFHKQNMPRLLTLMPRGHSGAALVWEDRRATGKEDFVNVFVQRLDDNLLAAPKIETPNLPSLIALDEVYPNPFNSRAMATFTNFKEGELSLALYDAQGRFALDLGSGYWSAGRHRVLVAADNLSSGSYFVRLEMGGHRTEQAIQLMK